MDTQLRIGIDIGGTQLRVALVTAQGEVVRREAVAHDHGLGPVENLDRLLEIVDGWGVPYAGIGVGAPGPLDFAAGRVLNPPNLPGWEGFGLADHLAQRTGKPVAVNNDANVAGLAEAIAGAGAGFESVFYFTVSTGVGGAYVYRREIVGGAHSCAAEVFNMPVADDAFHRPHMNPGALEDHASGTAIARMGCERLGRIVDAAEVFGLAQAGDEAAAGVIETAAENLARAVANVSFVVDPDVFVLGGSVALKNPGFIELVRTKACRYVLNPDTLACRLAACGDDAGLIGAALLI